MKATIKLLFFIFILLTTTLSVQAQSHLRRTIYGDFFAGMTFASFDMKNGNEYKKNKIGFMIGGNVNYKFLGYMELQSGFHILKKGSFKHQKTTKTEVSGRIEQIDVKNTIDANYVQVPLNIGFELPITKELYVNAHVGVFAAYGFKGRTKKEGFLLHYYEGNVGIDKETYDTDDKTFSSEKLKRWDYGIGANIGLVYDIYVLRLQYDHGLANVATNNMTTTDKLGAWKTRNYSVCIGFRF